MHRGKRLPLPPRRAFLQRLLRQSALALAVVLVALTIGTLGYRYFEDLPWLDALLNAAMILTSMGPVDQLHTVGGKLFATVYALFSGVIFLTMAALMFGPIFHRFLHRFHLELEGDGAES